MEQEQPQVKTEAPVDTNEPVFHDDNKKSIPTGLIIGMVLLALIAIGGVGFGVWEMTSQSQKVKDLETQVANCAAANGDESTENVTVTCPDGTEVEVENVLLENPVIESADPVTIQVSYMAKVNSFNAENKTATLNILAANGEVTMCRYDSNVGDCTISGLEGKIYKFGTIDEGNGPGYEKIGFLMEDGSVWYSYLYHKVDNGLEWKKEFVVKKVDINGFVKDIVSVGVSNANYTGGYASTMFILNDNSVVKYDESMFDESMF